MHSQSMPSYEDYRPHHTPSSWGLKHRVLLLALLPAICISLLLGVYFTQLRIRELENDLHARGAAIALRLALAAHQGVAGEARHALRELANTTLDEVGVLGVAFYDRNGRELAKAGSISPFVQPPVNDAAAARIFLEEHPQRLAFMVPVTCHDSDITDEDFYPILKDTVLQTKHSAEVLGWIRVEVDHTITRREEYQALFHSGLIVLLGLFISGLVAQRMGQKVTQPIWELTQAVESLKQGDFNTRVHNYTDWELSILESGINAMAKELQTNHEKLQKHIKQATKDLRYTLETLEERNLELEVARKQAEDHSRVKSEFLANMSHEIRTPLNGVIGFINLLHKTELNARQKDYLSTLQKSASSLLSIINDILDFSKIEAGKLRIERTLMDIRECIEDTLTLLAPSAQEKAIELIPIVYSDVPSRIIGDPLRIKQVLSNLVSNAIKFTEKGSVTVRVMLEKVGIEQITLCISVTDTGMGLSLQEQKELFHAFNQASPATPRKFGGTGLGLVICKKLIEQMHGEIGLESELEQGATFWFTFQVNMAADVPVIEEEKLQGVRLLFCERHPLARLSISHLLALWGLKAQEVDDLNHITPALQRAVEENNPFHLVVIGINQLGGLQEELAFTVASIRDHYGCPVGILANTTDYSLHNEILQLGASFYVAKPIVRWKLYEALCLIWAHRIGEPEIAAPEAALPIPVQNTGLAPVHILAVDDNAANLKLVAALLEEMGITVTVADCGLAALEISKGQRFDLILMDIRMPDIDGIETTRLIRQYEQEHNKQRTPIVALTAHAAIGEQNALWEVGIEDFLTKPISEPELRGLIYKWTPRGMGLTIDWHLGEKLAGGQKQLAEEMLKLLVTGLPADQLQVNQAFMAKDWEALRDHVHRLHGACCYCGVPRLKLAAKDLEIALSENQTSRIKEKLKDLNKEIEQVLNMSQAALKEQALFAL